MRLSRKLAAIVAVIAAVSLAPSAVLAQSRSEAAAIRYNDCMDRADTKLDRCLEITDITEFICWSRHGYAIFWCSVKYPFDAIF